MARSNIRIGISSCLLGQAVRYDGGHKHNEYIASRFGECFEFVPFCPEVAIGLGVPRPPIRLVRDKGDIRASGVDDSTLDVTDKLVAYAEHVVLSFREISGYIFKKDSPSCGMERVKVYRRSGAMTRSGVGLYAQTLMERLPALPCEDEERLANPVVRGNFIERVFVYRRWQELTADSLTPKSLVSFHTGHKFIVLAHDERVYRTLGRWVANAGRDRVVELGDRYICLLMQALKKPTSRARHANVLQHMAGFLKGNLNAANKRELLILIERYRRGRVPLSVPISTIRHYSQRFSEPYLEGQYYFDLYTDEFLLRESGLPSVVS